MQAQVQFSIKKYAKFNLILQLKKHRACQSTKQYMTLTSRCYEKTKKLHERHTVLYTLSLLMTSDHSYT